MFPLITVVLVDDDSPTLDYLEAWLTCSCHLPYQFHIHGRATSGTKAMKQIHAYQPDLVILDLSLPDMNGMAVAQFSQSLEKQPKILIFSGYDNWLEWKDTANKLLLGYVVKGSPLEALENTLAKLLKGELCWDPAVYYNMHQKSFLPSEPFVWVSPLTEREQDVFALFCRGFKQAKIADELKVSTNTVKTHLRKICKKAGCKELESLKKKAFYSGVIHTL